MSHSHIEILLVEDSPHEAKLTLLSLEEQGLANKVFHAVDGADALDFIFARGEYSHRASLPMLRLILLDLKLPKVSGLEVLEMLKTNELTKSIPVVILTSSREDKDIITGYALGVNSYVVKPVEFQSFSKSVAEVGQYWLRLNEKPLAYFK